MDDLRTVIKNLRKEIYELRERKKPTSDVWSRMKGQYSYKQVHPLKLRKTLVNKDDGIIRELDFGKDTQLMTLTAGATAAGSIVVWNIDTEQRENFIELNSTWILTAKIDHVEGSLVGVGGLENQYSIYRLGEEEVDDTGFGTMPVKQLIGHHAVLQDSCFVDGGHVLTAAGDMLMKYWDIEAEIAENTFEGHTSDLFCCTVSPTQKNSFLTGSGDFTARLWDNRKASQRRGGLVSTYDTRSRDVQSVEFFPEGNAFATGLSNTEVHLYDIRASCKIATFYNDSVYRRCGVEQVAFSSSGRLLFVRYAQGKCFVYDVTKTGITKGGDQGPLNTTVVGQLHKENSDKVLNVAVHKKGKCLAVGEGKRNSNDTIAKIYWPKVNKRQT